MFNQKQIDARVQKEKVALDEERSQGKVFIDKVNEARHNETLME